MAYLFDVILHVKYILVPPLSFPVPPQNIFGMDLRSAHKEKPPPRLRLSLTRAMSTDVEQGERVGVFRGPAWRKKQQRAAKRGPERALHKTIRPLRKKEKPLVEEWGVATSEEDKPEAKSGKEEGREDSSYGQFTVTSEAWRLLHDIEIQRFKQISSVTRHVRW